MVHQHFKLIEPLTVAEIIYMPSNQCKFMLNLKQMNEKIIELSNQFNLPVDPTAKIWQLSVGEQQRVEIVKLLFNGAEILILDEPTAVLTPQESRALFANLRKLADAGKAVLYITHKLFEVTENADRITVLRHGKSVATMRNENVFNPAALDDNSRAGADLLWAARYAPSMYGATTPFTTEATPAYSHMYMLMDWTAYLAQRGGEQRAAKILSAVAGSSIPAIGTAQRDALRSQVSRMRDHATSLGLRTSEAYNDLPYYHAWVEGTGSTAELNGDGRMSGYRYNAWGGSVGMDMDVDNTTSLGIGLTALYGDLKAGSADNLDGKLDSYYLSFMGRFKSARWGHTLVATAGLNQARMDRTVNYEVGQYKTHGNTDGWGVGLMYEVTYDVALNEEGSSILQPLFNVSVARTTLKGYTESGEEYLGLNVGKQEWTTSTVGVGVRWLTEVGESAFSRNAKLELRANVAQDLGDTQGETEVALLANPAVSRKVKATEVGSTALQLGVGLSLPVDENNQVYVNAGADMRAHMNSWNASVGYKISF